MKQKKLILVKLIGIGNNKDDDKNEKDDKDYNNDDEKSKSNYEYEGDDDSEYKNNKGSDNESNKGSDNENKVVIMRMKIVYINVLMRLVSIRGGSLNSS